VLTDRTATAIARRPLAGKQTAEIGDGRPGPGRPKGSSNKTTTALKEAILLAAAEVGEDNEGKGVSLVTSAASPRRTRRRSAASSAACSRFRLRAIRTTSG